MKPGFLPHGFLGQIALFLAAALSLSLGLFATYMVLEEAQFEIKRTHLRALAIARSLSSALAEPVLLRDYASIGRVLLSTAESDEIRALRVLSRNGATLSYVTHEPGRPPEEQFEYTHFTPPGTDTRFFWLAEGQTELMPDPEWDAQQLVLFHPLGGGTKNSVLRIDLDATHIREAVMHKVVDTAIAALLALTLSIGLLLVFLRKPLAAFAQATAFARDLTDHLGEQMEVYRGNREQEALGEALNHTSLWLFTQSESLAQTGDRLAAVLTHVPDALLTVDASGHIESANPAASRMSGLAENDLVGQPIQALLPDWQPQWLIEGARVCETACRKAGHGNHPVEIALASFGVRERRNWIVVMRDIRAQRAHEEELRRARDQAEAANRAKSEFLAAMSHEIRTPMNGVLGMTELALSEAHRPEQREQLELVKSSAEHLLTLINEILDFSKIEAGRLELVEAPLSLHALLDQIVRQLSVQAQAKGLALTHSIDPDTPQRVMGDEARLRQVLINLVGNAIKFTDRGGVHISLTVRRNVETGQPNIDFAVRDTGIGIARERIEAIFEPFVQAEGGLDRRYGGTGLGLSIARQLVEKMHGAMRVDSRPGQGSTFHFSALLLPVSQDQDGTQAATSAPKASTRDPSLHPELPRLHLLVAEDNPVNQKLISALITKLGCTFELAGSGHEALALLDKGHFDMGLFDVQMPEMDGLEVLAGLRAREQGSGHHLPVIMLTAHAMAGDRERFLAAGADGYVSKPIRFDALRAQLAELAPPTPRREYA